MVLEARGRGPESDRLHKNLQTSRNSALCPLAAWTVRLIRDPIVTRSDGSQQKC